MSDKILMNRYCFGYFLESQCLDTEKRQTFVSDYLRLTASGDNELFMQELEALSKGIGNKYDPLIWQGDKYVCDLFLGEARLFKKILGDELYEQFIVFQRGRNTPRTIGSREGRANVPCCA